MKKTARASQSGLVRPVPSAWYSVQSSQSGPVPVSGLVPVQSSLSLLYVPSLRSRSESLVRSSQIRSSFVDPKIKAIQTKAQSYKRKAQSLPWRFPYSKTTCLKTFEQNANCQILCSTASACLGKDLGPQRPLDRGPKAMQIHFLTL